ncbi:acyltransferase family protein [Marinactinospora thermotolerans]|uniref:Fucose 4-O-acetylase n=1 Tax=Marinactinospora thermotolerans DSM 45154 TaxID=1122192 RepID=A0A1T4MUX9_9ACTN|nr:acyltransferase family protein [Marinactinospora thermotolerans]SJZ70654.1 Fucose 4-O-acetylase [Marinactinospora thermotolerans DSM 45154]
MTEQVHPPTAPGRPEPPRTAGRPRLYYVDNLRVVLTVLVLAHHVAVTYGNIPVWYYSEPATDGSGALLDLLVITNQTFFMGFFFLISGYFVPGSHDRKGGRGFVRERLVRLGVPLLLFLLILRPIVMHPSFVLIQEASAAEGTELPYWLFYLLSWDPGPLWFAEVLLVFCLVYVLVRRLRDRRAKDVEAVPAAPGRLPGPLAVVAFTVGLALVSHVWRTLFPALHWPVVGLPSPQYLPQYVALFVVGVFAFRGDWPRRIPRKAGGVALAVAGVALTAWIAVHVLWDGTVPGPDALAPAVLLLVESTFAVSVIIALTVLFRERFNRQGRFGRLLADNAFAVYVLHPLVLIGVSMALSGWEAIAVAKFAVVLVLSVPLCWLVAVLVRAIPGVKRFL